MVREDGKRTELLGMWPVPGFVKHLWFKLPQHRILSRSD